MSKKISEVSATATQVKQTETSATVASSTVRRRKTHSQVYNEGYDAGIRHAAEAMLGQGESRDYIAEVITSSLDIPFPFTAAPEWEGWNYEDWDDWVAGEE